MDEHELKIQGNKIYTNKEKNGEQVGAELRGLPGFSYRWNSP